jgi:DNA replication protein DnaC
MNMLVVLGPPGTGKTYFCAALLGFLPKGTYSVRAYSERALLRRLRNGIKDQSAGDYLQHLEHLVDDDFIIIDDVGSSGHTDWREEVLMELIDYRYSNRKPTVITSNLSPVELRSVYGSRIASRLLARENTVIDMSSVPDLRQHPELVNGVADATS